MAKIEKLSWRSIWGNNGFIEGVVATRAPNDAEITEKINEIIDAIYDLQLAISRLDPNKAEKECRFNPVQTDRNAQDEFAEQRKWIGKLCKFSNNDGFDEVGYLTEIDPDMPEAKFRCNCHDYYKECEPVKPDDDIIYKGGGNE